MDLLPSYPHQAWFRRVVVTALVIGSLFTVAYGIAVGVRMYQVSDSRHTAYETGRANDLWKMVAGTAPIEPTPLGDLAVTARDLSSEPNPVRALLGYYVTENRFPGVSDELGYTVFSERTDRGDTDDTRGHFAERFVLDVLQANPDNVSDVIRPIPPVRDSGLFRLDWGLSALGGWTFLSLLVYFVLWLRRKRWYDRKYQGLTAEAKEVYGWVEAIQDAPASSERDQVLREAKALFASLQTGFRGADSSSDIALMRSRLAELSEALQLKLKAYDELNRLK